GVRSARQLPHPHGDVTHRLDESSTLGRDDTAETSERALGNVFREVCAPLELGNDLSEREQIFEFVTLERLDGNAVTDEGGQLLSSLVDHPVLGDNPIGQVDVLVKERRRGPAEALGHQGEEPNNRIIDAIAKLVAAL